MDSSEFMTWGSHGAGRWIAVFGNAGHAYMDVAGLRLDTSAADDPTDQQGPRWRPLRIDKRRLHGSPPARALSSSRRPSPVGYA